MKLFPLAAFLILIMGCAKPPYKPYTAPNEDNNRMQQYDDASMMPPDVVGAPPAHGVLPD